MEKLSEMTGDEHAGQEYLQSHPLTSKRIENARRLMKQE
jgi:predicted Zn-dependent protease